MADRFAGGNRYAGLDTPVKYGAWLRARIKEYGVSVSEVAGEIGVAPGTVYNWLKGKLPRLPRSGESDRFEDGLLTHPALALSSSQREHLAEQRRVLVGAATDAAPEAVPDWPQRALPAAVPTFTGRYTQLDQLNRLLVRRERGQAVVISALSGLGGIGKTALAVQWAHSPEVRRTFTDGAVYVNLNGFAETEPMAPTDAQARLLRQLGVKPQAIPLDAEALGVLYQDSLADRDLLLVLDNARDEPQVRSLLPRDARCLAVVTSRNRLAGLTVSHDATCLSLDALTPRESARLLRRLLGGVADREPEAVAPLAEACAHLPLALRIAAANHLADPDRTSLGDYVAELTDDRLAKLAVGATDPATAITSVLDRSYRNLTVDGKRALRLLSSHPGADWDRFAAAALLDVDLDAVDERLRELLDHCLIDEFDAQAGQRYRVHDLTVEYARTHPDCEARQRDHALSRLWNYLRAAACAAMEQFAPEDKYKQPPLPQKPRPVPRLSNLTQATEWLGAERDNLLTAINHCADNGDSENVLALAGTIFRYLELQGHWRDGVVMSELEREHTTPAARHRALNRLGVMWDRLESPGAGRDHFEQALVLARREADTATEISILNNLGVMCLKTGLFEEAINHYRHSSDVALKTGDPARLARVLVNLSVVYIHRGDNDLAAEHCHQALTIAREHNAHSVEAFTLNNLGCIYENLEDLAAAAEHFRQGLDVARRLGVRIVERACLTGLGSTSERQELYDDALRYYREALSLSTRVGDRSGRASVLNHLSANLRRLDRLHEAVEYGREALALTSATDNRIEQARAYDNLAHTLAVQGDTEAAHDHWTEALRIFTELGTPEAAEVKQQLDQLPS